MEFSTHLKQDIPYYNQAAKAAYKVQRKELVIKEVNGHIDDKYHKLLPINQLTKGHGVLPSAWTMIRKRDICTCKVYKHKARLNMNRGKQEYAINLFEDLTPISESYSSCIYSKSGIPIRWIFLCPILRLQ